MSAIKGKGKGKAKVHHLSSNNSISDHHVASTPEWERMADEALRSYVGYDPLKSLDPKPPKAPLERQRPALADCPSSILESKLLPWPSPHKGAPSTLEDFQTYMTYLRDHSIKHIRIIMCKEPSAYWAPVLWDMYTNTTRAVTEDMKLASDHLKYFKDVYGLQDTQQLEWPESGLSKGRKYTESDAAEEVRPFLKFIKGVQPHRTSNKHVDDLKSTSYTLANKIEKLVTSCWGATFRDKCGLWTRFALLQWLREVEVLLDEQKEKIDAIIAKRFADPSSNEDPAEKSSKGASSPANGDTSPESIQGASPAKCNEVRLSSDEPKFSKNQLGQLLATFTDFNIEERYVRMYFLGWLHGQGKNCVWDHGVSTEQPQDGSRPNTGSGPNHGTKEDEPFENGAECTQERKHEDCERDDEGAHAGKHGERKKEECGDEDDERTVVDASDGIDDKATEFEDKKKPVLVFNANKESNCRIS
ncbi:hypothetical protein BDW02DRAFT_621593 [Decorospora gaudefroyi]|uniref:Uncharacterized protein n=1 Tax=Decorospora gaudefroyi TaxID=184978 RepID=A0A6A5KRH4_9PLEO|nr:hypothetical protein BDW02DRAFT_621593 [Decorospora gaudefroyi]